MKLDKPARKLGKFLSRLFLFSLLVSSCSDDDFADTHQPLQVSVTANSPLVSRAIITDEWLPDAASIGATLFDATGTGYDEIPYNNIKYTAAGIGADQVWSTASAVSVSATPGTLLAYYPWQDGVDLTAVPVETATQTDYMYSKPVTGLSLASPKANITMKHALTAIRVCLVLGDFTGDASVSAVSVSSPALGTAASLDVLGGEGALADITGQGEVLMVDVDFDMTTAGKATDVMMVPDGSVTAGTTHIEGVVGGKKYAVNVPFTESYLQGVVYTYNITLNNTGFVVNKVSVTPWGEGSTTSNQLAYTYQENDYIVKINVPFDDYEFSHNMIGYEGIIDWGDGHVQSYEYNDQVEPAHVYDKAGEYTVRFTGTVETLYSANNADLIITEVVHAGDELDISDIEYAFYKQSQLAKVPEGLFDSCNNNVTSAAYTFFSCSSLQTIPADLLDDLQYVTDFSYTFQSSGLKEIPEGLFDNCTEVMYWGSDCVYGGTFSYCYNLTAIPAGIFNKCTKTTLFGPVFTYCTGLTSIPDDMFNGWTSVQTFDNTFQGCTGLTSIGERAFANCPDLTNMEETFFDCTSLTTVSGNIFENSDNLSYMFYTWADCSNFTSIPEGLFENKSKITVLNSIFAYYGIVNIGKNAFKGTGLTSLESIVNTNTKKTLKSIGDGAFENCTSLTKINLNSCEILTDIAETAFKGCTAVASVDISHCTALQEIPAGLFDSCIKATSFYETFQGCTALTSIPSGLFDKCTEVTSFNRAFEGCTGITSIPEGLFDNCTKVTSFSGTFWGCENLTSIPEGLFDKCTEVTSFYGTFYKCTSLTGESPYTVIQVDGIDTKVHLYERKNYPVHFTAPTSYADCFEGCIGLSDYETISTSYSGWI